ncbi:MAG: LCP family protein [Actinomycetes bacterium]
MSSHRRGRTSESVDVSLAARLGSDEADPAAPPAPTSRRARRARKRRTGRRRLLIGIAVVVTLALIAAAALALPVLLGGGSDKTATPPVQRTQKTLTLMLAGSESPAFSTALMAADATANTGVVVPVPTQLLVQGPTPDAMAFGNTVRLPDPAAPGTALEDTLSVIVDATWRLSPSGLSSLVDSVGGVPVTVEEDVVLTRRDGRQVVVVQGGSTKLNGAEAAAYSAVLPDGQEEQARLAHFNEVLFALIPKLPSNTAQLTALLDGLGQESAVTKDTSWLAQFLLDEQKAMVAGTATAQTLPVQPLDVGGPQTPFAVDTVPAEALMASAFADSRPSTASQPLTVLVQNGVGRPGLVESAGAQLRDAGYGFVNGGNANRFGYTKTVVVVADSSDAALADGRAVAKTLGVPSSSVEVAQQGQTVADVLVILGADYAP